MVEPGDAETESLVLLGVDRGQHGSGHPLAVPGTRPERRVEPRRGEPPHEVLLDPLAALPVVGESLDVGVPDPAMVPGSDGPDLETIGEGSIGDRCVESPPHLEAVADDAIAMGGRELGVAGDLRVAPAA